MSVNKTAQQYKTYGGCLTCVADEAVDRDMQTCAQMDVIGISSPDKTTWWRVDLGGIYNVFNIKIQFRDDYGSKYSK